VRWFAWGPEVEVGAGGRVVEDFGAVVVVAFGRVVVVAFGRVVVVAFGRVVVVVAFGRVVVVVAFGRVVVVVAFGRVVVLVLTLEPVEEGPGVVGAVRCAGGAADPGVEPPLHAAHSNERAPIRPAIASLRPNGRRRITYAITQASGACTCGADAGGVPTEVTYW
jgi:hypothetical protein